MKMLKTIPVFILLFTGYLCNAQTDETTLDFSPTKGGTEKFSQATPTTPWAAKKFSLATPTTPRAANEILRNYHVPAERSLPTLVVAGVSIALVLLCILIVAVFWYAWKKSQEGSMVLNPIPYGEAGVSLQNPSAPESQREWPSERAVP